ncbi:MAG: hypothetical protein L0027_05580 [Candidatus Rokubacteria bacterium]|nr:hypothetical protein [Candidatus Rokubacteria bacterium]
MNRGRPAAASRLFLLSPAHCGGERARLVLNPRAPFDLARRLHTPPGAPLGEVFSLLSGLYFRGKLAYARAFARPPAGFVGAYVITPSEGVRPSDELVDAARLRAFAEVPIDLGERRYRMPLERDIAQLARTLPARAEVVLLGSVATGKYVDVLLGMLGARLLFPSAFVGRGDMSRGGLMLRAVRSGTELECIPVQGALRRGPRPERLSPPRG